MTSGASARGSAEPAPLRAEPFSINQMERHALTLANWHQVSASPGASGNPLLARLADNQRFLSEAHGLVVDAVLSDQQITPAAEWFVDNYHLIEEQIRLARRHLPRGYSRELPRLLNGPSAGLPRVYDLALELISHTHGRVDLECLRGFLASYQAVQPLALGELWAIPIMLRLALLENLRRVVAAVTAGRRDRARAAAWAERLLDVAASEPARVVLVLAEMIHADPPLSDAFVAELTSRLQGQGPALVFPISWLEQRLAERGQTIEHAYHLTTQSQAADQVSIGNSIGSLRLLGATDWRDFVESASAVEALLRAEPCGVYATMDFATRDRYRHAVEAIARHSPLTQEQVAELALELAAAAARARQRHVGYFLVDAGRPILERAAGMRGRPGQWLRGIGRRLGLGLYVAAVVALTLSATALVLSLHAGFGPGGSLNLWAQLAVGALLLFCALHLAVAVVQWLATLLVEPRTLPRLDFSEGIPAEQRTAVVVPTLLSDAETVDELVEQLEIRFLANRDPELWFGLLTDFRDAPSESMPEDEALVRRAREGIEALNAKYAGAGETGHFFLCHRARRWNAREGVWMGWERKRGKLEDFNALARGELARFALRVGPIDALQSCVHAIVLDSDTELPRDAARQLVGTLAHPLNRPVWSDGEPRVLEGYTILQPRVGISMPSACRSLYARLFAGQPGIDPYTRAVSDVYQDLFAEGSFIGKGIYAIDAMRAACDARLPENRILSHDLLEGAYARAGLISEAVLYEAHPAAHAADVARRARWIRGDWQIARWLLRGVPGRTQRVVPNPISRLSQLKILDNLRRSLVPAALFALLVTGFLTPALSTLALGAVLAALFLPTFLIAAGALARPRTRDVGGLQNLREVADAQFGQMLRETFALAVLPFDAAVSLAAIGQALVRLLFTRRKLLEWQTAADAARSARTSLLGTYASMWILPFTASLLMLALAWQRSPVAGLAAPVLALWWIAPALAWWLSAPLVAAPARLAPEDVAFLRAVARRTWHFFETSVGAEDHDLPPDNVQQDPPVGVAHRTSPTNIGCALGANLAAYDFGYATAGDLIARTARTLATLERLPRYRGHFYNWYDTRTLEPLRPMYVSTVDSGNLSGFLLTLAAGLGELHGQPVFRPALYAGMRDTLEVLAEAGAPALELGRVRGLLHVFPSTLAGAHLALGRLASATRELARAIELRRVPELGEWAQALERQVSRALAELHHMAPWVDLPNMPERPDLRELAAQLDELRTLGEVARIEALALPAIDRALAAERGDDPAPRGARAWLTSLRAALICAAERASSRTRELQRLALCCAQLADHEVEFLYDRSRHLLAIGYNVVDHRLDTSFYDLLASEARLASYLAIAQGKLPQEHWFHLGRQLTTTRGRPALLSWSGSMFEYLMPLLVMPSHPGTMLDTTYRAVVDRQIAYGRAHGVPWGISESGYNKTDAQLNYQYRAFGVPGLGFKRGLADDLVIAPYASMLALMVAPEAACANLRRLAREGRLGPYGFCEAIDYTPARLPPGKESAEVRAYMAHHQGMGFLSLAHLLLDRPMQRRFAADPALRATDLLLQERVPRAPAIHPHAAEESALRRTGESEMAVRLFKSPHTPTPEVILLSNGRYHVAVTQAGAGYSRWRDLAVTRWHEDPTCDAWGSFCYLRDPATGSFWSVAHQPTLRPAKNYEAIFSAGRAEFRRSDEGLDTHVEISVSPEDDIELRRISITNLGPVARTIELTSFAEVVLATPAADAAHPAFSNLFVQTELIRQHQAILCTRRPRSAGERPPWMLHLMSVHGPLVGATSFETARAAFIGRGRTAVDPLAMQRPALGDTQGAVLDPIVSIRNTVEIAADETVRVHLVTGVAETREGALALIEKYTDRHLAERVFELSWTQSQVLQGRLGATSAEAQVYDRLAGDILYSGPALRAPKSVIARNRAGQSGLWAYGISGDLPIVLVRIADAEHVGLVRDLVRAHAYWRMRGLSVDLVVWNEDPSGYRQNLQDSILAIIATLADSSLIDRPGGIFVRRSDQMSEEDSVLMQTVARVILSDTAGSLAEQLERRPRGHARVPQFVPRERAESLLALAPRAATAQRALERPDLVAFNGIGGFTRDGREYVITTTRELRTPAPWSNVLANPYFGSVVSESGGAYTWCENAHSYRLTPWHNDPVSDTSGEAMYVRDEEDGHYWSPTPLPAGGPNPYTTRHGFGYSVFEYAEGGMASELQTFVAIGAPVKFLVLKLRNLSGRPRRLSVSAFFELVLGAQRGASLPHVVSEVDLKTSALFARNAYAAEFAQRIAFLDCSDPLRTVSGDRKEFLGRNGDRARPQGMAQARLSGRVGAGLDACFAMQVMLELADGQEREVAFVLGSGRDLDDARHLVQRYRGTGPAQAAREEVGSYWNRTLGAVEVRTPDPALDCLANGWLIYQVLACRMWARSGFYQSGGAFGFRDQLQDAGALIHAEPAVVREHLLRAAAHQFPEGDVQHWWHPPLGRGVRTRISDDYLWLPSAVCRYVDAVGDSGVLDENVEFIEGRPVKPDEDSYYDLPTRSGQVATLYEHCVRALQHGLRFGAHGLPLMGTGDWNDAMNLVGDEGKGESVWLGFFLYDVLTRFADLARRRGDGAFADTCVSEAARLRANLEEHGWDGQWYRRAYFDNGLPLGSKSSPECFIDSLPQSWAALSKAADPERVRQALAAVDALLVDRELGVIKLFDPPFDRSDLEPGYVKGYVPGVRENGGQYTHAAIWVVMAHAAVGDAARAWELFERIQPLSHSSDPAALAAYKVEPYVVAADVYTNPEHAGRGGWTWYTGSAGWMYRLIVESLLGLHLEVDRLRVEPLVPPSWPSFDVDYRWRGGVYHIRVVNRGGGRRVERVVADGAERADHTIPLCDDRQEHWAEVTLAAPASQLAPDPALGR